MKTLTACCLFLLTYNQSLAMSRLYDYDGSAVIVNGKPCFYTNRPVDSTTPSHLRRQGVQAEVYEEYGGTKWDAWFSQRLESTPASPQACLPYGTVSPDDNRILATPLNFETPYLFLLTGEYGRYGIRFCLIRSTQSRARITRSEFKGKWICTDKPLPSHKLAA